MSKNKANAVGHIPSGLFIVTAQHGGTNTIDGFLASWVQQVSFEPLLVSLCIKSGRPVYDAIKSGALFTINVVGKHDGTYLKHFWQGFDSNKNVFNAIEHEVRGDGAVLITQAKSSIVCRLKSSSQPGDHEVIIAEVVDSIVHDEDAKPQVHIRKSGLDY